MTTRTPMSGASTSPNVEMRRTYLGKMESQLRDFDQKLNEFREKLTGAKENVRADLMSFVERSRSKLDAARGKLGELSKAGDDAFDDLKAGFERAWSELQQSYEQARGKLH